MAPKIPEEIALWIAAHRAEKAIERSSAGKVLRRFAKQVRERHFARRSTFFYRERGHLIQFLHVHKFSFGPSFRIHACIRVLNDPLETQALNGIASDQHPHYRESIAYRASGHSINDCAAEMIRYVVEVAEPWFNQQTYSALLSKDSCIQPEGREALAAALRGESDEANVARSRALFIKA